MLYVTVVVWPPLILLTVLPWAGPRAPLGPLIPTHGVPDSDLLVWGLLSVQDYWRSGGPWLVSQWGEDSIFVGFSESLPLSTCSLLQKVLPDALSLSLQFALLVSPAFALTCSQAGPIWNLRSEK